MPLVAASAMCSHGRLIHFLPSQEKWIAFILVWMNGDTPQNIRWSWRFGDTLSLSFKRLQLVRFGSTADFFKGKIREILRHDWHGTGMVGDLVFDQQLKLFLQHCRPRHD